MKETDDILSNNSSDSTLFSLSDINFSNNKSLIQFNFQPSTFSTNAKKEQ